MCSNNIYNTFSASVHKAHEKAEKAIYTSDMDTEKETKDNRKHRAKKIMSSSEDEEEHCTNIIVPSPPHPPAKGICKRM